MENQKKILMIVSDIDGTLLRSDGTVSPHTVEVIHAAQARGVLFSVCSGRYPEHADVILRTFGIRGLVCGNNGATLWDARTDTALCDHLIDAEAAQRVREALEKLDINFMTYCRKYVGARNADILRLAQSAYGPVLKADYHVAFAAGSSALDEALRRGVNKFYCQFDTADQRERLLIALWAISGLCVTTSGRSNVEIIPAECSKAGGVAEMANLYHVAMENVMTIGDYENDVPMLRAAGLGVAMGNANAAVQAQADCVTDTNDQDGLAKAIEKYVLHS